MFSQLKAQVEEDTGMEFAKISSLVATPPKVPSNTRHSRTGSAASLTSFTIDGTKDDTPAVDLKLADGRPITPKEFKRLEAKEDEWRKKLQKKDDEFATQLKKADESWKKKIDDKEKDLQRGLEKKDIEISALLSEIKDLQAYVDKLEKDVKLGEEYKIKLCRAQEDLDQLDGFQNQEMAKIKHLLLQKEQLLMDKEKTCNNQSQKIGELNSEIRRLLDAERKLSDSEDRLEELRHTSEQEKAGLTSRLAAEEESSRHLKDRIAVLEERSRAGCVSLGAELTFDDRLQGLLGERALLERLLAEAHEHLAEVKTTWSGKITSLETQVGRLCRQASEESGERRVAEKQRDSLASQVRALETNALENEQRIACLTDEKNRLQEELKTLDAQLVQQSLILADSLSSVNKDALSAQSQLEQQSRLIVTKEETISRLSCELDNEKELAGKLANELKALRAAYDEDKAIEEQLREDVTRERSERDVLMLRNAEVSQEAELVRRDLRSARQEAHETQTKVAELENCLRLRDENLGKEKIEKDILARRLQELEVIEKEIEADNDVREKNNELKSEMVEKNRLIKTLQQRINDIKKAMQRELKVPSRLIDPGGQNGDGCIPAHGPAVLTASSCDDPPDDVNFKYLKHVVFKFLTCREHEAQHLTRAVSTLLRLSSEEDQLLRETLDWRTSWFGSRPKSNFRS